MSLKRAWIQTALLAILCFICPTSSAQLLKPQDVNKLPAAPLTTGFVTAATLSNLPICACQKEKALPHCSRDSRRLLDEVC